MKAAQKPAIARNIKSHSLPHNIALVGVILSSFCATANAATASWSKEQILSPTTGAYNVRTAINASGRSVFVWDETVISPANPYGGTGQQRVYAAVCDPSPAISMPVCTTPQMFTDGSTNATNAGATVSPDGNVSVFWNRFDTPTGSFAEFANSRDGGYTWSTAEQIPAPTGYTLMAGVYSEVGPSVGVDGAGNLVMALTTPRTYPISPTNTFSIIALSRNASSGTWSAPQTLCDTASNCTASIFGSARLYVNSDGQAMLNLGFTTFRRSASGQWNSPQTVSTAGKGQIYSASAGFDASARGYFIYRTRYNGAFISTSTPTTAWSTPKHIAKFDTLGQNALICGSGANQVMVYGQDVLTNGQIRASVSKDGGVTWGSLLSLGTGASPKAAGSENGLYIIGWDSAGTNADRYMVATGSGVGTGAIAWTKKLQAGSYATGGVAIKATDPSQAAVASGWTRFGTSDNLVGAATGSTSP